MTKKIIIDCDNTFSIDNCDIDDGLAIIYTLAQDNTEILGINTTFGNNKLEIIYPNTISFMKNIGYSHIPIYKGAIDSYENNEAAKFLVKMADKYNGELSILATGSLTNLYHAWQIDNTFYEKIKNISLMGGIIKPLVINNKILNELNFSCNYKAALSVLENGKSITIVTGNTCLDGFFTKKRFNKLEKGNDFEKWLYQSCIYWFDREKNIFGNNGIYIWDVMAAAALLNPHLFMENILYITPDEEGIKRGLLLGKGNMKKVTIPKIKDTDKYIEHVYEQFKIFGENTNLKSINKPVFQV